MGETPPKGTARPSTARPSSVVGAEAPPPRLSRTITPLPITAQRFMLELTEGSPVGDYEIQSQIGEGAMGTVYSAVHGLVGKPVAIKVLKPELCTNQTSIDRFVQEAQAVNRIGHPNIVDVYSLDTLPDGRAYMVMEWLHGEDLKVRLARGPVTVADACEILDGIARALDAAHAKDIVHRDLKPDNVFLHRVENGPEMVKLLDFGIAKLMRSQAGMEKTQTGNMLGTPRYISPEQARGVDVTPRSDIYSLGVLAYEMLAGRPPFQGETGMDLVIKHLSETPPPLSQFARVPKPLEQCVMRMLSKDPAQRPTLAEIRQTLHDPTRRVSRAGLPGAKKLAIALGGVALVAGAAFASWQVLGARHATAPAAQVASGVQPAPAAETRPRVRPLPAAALEPRELDAITSLIGATIDADARAARLRAEAIATSSMLRAAIATDAETLADMARDKDVVLPVQEGESLEVFQVVDGTRTSLLRIPAHAPAIEPPVDGASALGVRADGVLAVTSIAKVELREPTIAGEVVLAVPIDLGAVRERLAGRVESATITGLAMPVVLVEDTRRPGELVTLPIANRVDPTLALAIELRGTTARPARPASPVGARSTVEVNVTGPKGARIFIDDTELGTGPKVKAEVEAGDHEIEVRAPGRRPTVQHVTIEAGQDAIVAIVVPMAPPRRIVRPVKRAPPKPAAPAKLDEDGLLKPKDVLKKKPR